MLRLLSLLPLGLLYPLFGAVAWLLRLVGWRRNLVDEGLAHCVPALDPPARARLVRDSYAYLGELVAEVVHAQRISPSSLADRMRFENPEVVRGALAAGKRVVLLAAHHCNWEWLLLRCSVAFDEPLVAAYKPASGEGIDALLQSMRSRFGATMVPARQVVPYLLERRGGVRLLALVADQSPAALSEQQSWLSFLGRETAFYRGPGWIGAKMGYLPVFVALRREGRGRYVGRLVPLCAADERPDPDRILRAYVRALEELVREHPAEYFWAYNRWKRAKRLYD